MPEKKNLILLDEDEVNTGESDENYYDLFKSKISVLLDVVKKDLNIDEFNTSFGETLKPFGVGRIKVMEVICTLVKIQKPQINQALAESQLFKILLVNNLL